MEIRKWWQDLKKEKERKKLVQAAKELEAKADPSFFRFFSFFRFCHQFLISICISSYTKEAVSQPPYC